MWHLSTIKKRIVSLMLIATLAVAPVSAAFAACLATSMDMNQSSAEGQSDCDTPCNDCDSDVTKKFCQGDCVCVKTVVAALQDFAAPANTAARSVPGEYTGLHSPVHPPDPPPPRRILV